MRKLTAVALATTLGIAMAGDKKKVGLVFDVGGLGDKSFNDAANRGLEKAKKDLSVDAEYKEPGEGNAREGEMRRFAAKKFDLVFGIGFLFTDDITNLAEKFPKVHFACVDYTVTEKKIPDNLVALRFKEHEGSFLVGALAALLSKSGKIGFVGGMNIPLIHKFEAGYKAGAKHVNEKVEVIASYAGNNGEAFKNPTKGKELALAQLDRGVDIIFHASGSTGLGVFEACKERKAKAIGVDSDQYDEKMPDTILTSMVKHVEVAVFETIKAETEGKFKGGVKELGLAEEGVGYVYDDHNKKMIPDEIRTKVEALKKEIVDGKIKVPFELDK
ncbi:MAG TPA: BMP family ABC transporter substrate-binding protein [Planctomycetota bacterium]|nr:BMP family ABC transporter substrate-binding protein [Planctomycetota bacterium]